MPIFAVWNEYNFFSSSEAKTYLFISLNLRPLLNFYHCENDVTRFFVTVLRPYIIDDVMSSKMAIQ